MSEHYILLVVGCVEPELLGPYASFDERDLEARRIRNDGDHYEDGIFWLDNDDGVLKTGAYSAGFMEGLDDE